jgi:hypothetical protein
MTRLVLKISAEERIMFLINHIFKTFLPLKFFMECKKPINQYIPISFSLKFSKVNVEEERCSSGNLCRFSSELLRG